MEWILQVPVLLFSIIFHEFAHGFAAHRRGDDTAYLSGRLSFNPIPHIDPIGTVLLPAACAYFHYPMIGWAKPVPVNPYRLYEPRKDMAMVALSGPASNLLLALLSVLVIKALILLRTDPSGPLMVMAVFAVRINVLLMVFNLFPVFPLDGSHIALRFLKGRALELYEKHLPYGAYILFGLFITGLLWAILGPVNYLVMRLMMILLVL